MQGIRAYGERNVKIQTFLTSKLHDGEWSDSHCQPSDCRRKDSGLNRVGGFIGSNASLNASLESVGNRKTIPRLSNLRSCHYTERYSELHVQYFTNKSTNVHVSFPLECELWTDGTKLGSLAGSGEKHNEGQYFSKGIKILWLCRFSSSVR